MVVRKEKMCSAAAPVLKLETFFVTLTDALCHLKHIYRRSGLLYWLYAPKYKKTFCIELYRPWLSYRPYQCRPIYTSYSITCLLWIYWWLLQIIKQMRVRLLWSDLRILWREVSFDYKLSAVLPDGGGSTCWYVFYQNDSCKLCTLFLQEFPLKLPGEIAGN